MINLRYIFPKTENFREKRPDICWEHMYGWMEGYGVLFDPLIQSTAGNIPEWENGWNGSFQEGDFIITACAQASESFGKLECPGIYIRPSVGIEILERARISEKEKLATPLGDYYYPCGFLFDRYKNASSAWRLSDMPAIFMNGDSLALGFELFAMFGSFRTEMPGQCFTACADIVAKLLEECGLRSSQNGMTKWQSDTRMDFQAYGLNRLFIQWFLEINGMSKNTMGDADIFYSNALAYWHAGGECETAELLGKAFKQLADIRKKISQTDILFLEFPHLGILFEDKGFFELEWPEYSREIISSYFEMIEKHGYRTSLEAGASCWENLVDRYPEMGCRLKELWARKTIELTNGTFSLPYALMSPLSLQYWQLRKGGETFRKTFGKSPDTYQCQENSFTAQMPELLKYFGYRRALHITQNHGEAPSNGSEFIRWISPAGHGLIAMTAPNPALGRKGNNFFLDLPLVHSEYVMRGKSLNYVNFQDLAYVPFRIQMVQAHKYAAIWGWFALPEEAFSGVSEETLESKSYFPDAYRFSEKFFYPNGTNVNALSHYEQIYSLTGLRRQLLFAAYATGMLPGLFESINEVIGQLCLLEAHDCCYVQGQRRGEFHSSNTIKNPPYSHETLSRKLAEIASAVFCSLNKTMEKIAGAKSSAMYNASETMLSFARLKSCVELDGKNAAPHVGGVYASGPFKSFSSSEVATDTEMKDSVLPFDNGVWKVQVDSLKIAVSYKGQKLSFRPTDKKCGRFKLVKSELKQTGVLNFAKFTWMLEEHRIQIVSTTVIFTGDGDYMEIAVRYSPRNDFDATDKWSDCLALELDTGFVIDNAFRFNPNVRSLTAENRVSSPYYLAAESSRGDAVSFMNEGASLYEIDRKDGKVSWLFHVACESVHERRMGIVFGQSDAFQLSRAWSQGVIPVSGITDDWLNRQNWDGISAEDFIEPDTMLISNLKSCRNDLPISGTMPILAKNMAGESIITDDENSRSLSLREFELALMKIKKCDEVAR